MTKEQAGKTGNEAEDTSRPGDQQMVFPTIGDPEAEQRQEAEEARRAGREPPESGGRREGGGEDRTAALERQLEQERREASERERRMQSTLERLAAAPAGAAPAQPGGGTGTGGDDDAEIDRMLESLPDPVNHPKEYNRKMLEITDKRAEKRAREIAGQSQASNARDTQAQELWGRFESRYAGLARYDVVVEGIARKEFDRLRRSGVDPLQYAAADPDAFVDRIAGEARSYLSERGVKIGEGEGGGEGGERPDPSQQQRGNGSGGGRTAGIDGAEPSRRPGAGHEQQRGQSFIDELKNEQVRSGFF